MGSSGPWLRVVGLASPAPVCGGSLRALPRLGQFCPARRSRVRGAGWARPPLSLTRPATADLPHAPPSARWATRLRAAPQGRSPRSLSGWPPGGRAGAGVPAGLRLGRRVLRARLRPPRHVLGQRRQRPLPSAPPGLEQRLPAAGEGAAGPGEERGGDPRPRERRGSRGSFRLPEPISSRLPSGPRTPLQLCSHGTVIIIGHVLECCVPGPAPRTLYTLPFYHSSNPRREVVLLHVTEKETEDLVQGRPPNRYQVGILILARGPQCALSYPDRLCCFSHICKHDARPSQDPAFL